MDGEFPLCRNWGLWVNTSKHEWKLWKRFSESLLVFTLSPLSPLFCHCCDCVQKMPRYSEAPGPVKFNKAKLKPFCRGHEAQGNIVECKLQFVSIYFVEIIVHSIIPPAEFVVEPRPGLAEIIFSKICPVHFRSESVAFHPTVFLKTAFCAIPWNSG